MAGRATVGMLVLGWAMFSAVVGVASASPYATTVISYTAGSNAASGYTDPSTVLGSPERYTGEGVWPGDVTVFNGAWGTDEVVSIGAGGSLVVAFDHAVQDHALNPYGLDLLIFGNAFFDDPSYNGIASGISSAEPAKVAVSQDGIAWYEISGVFADGLFPTQGYTDTSGPYESDGKTPSDFTKPVDPTVAWTGKTYAELLSLYNGSGGGTGIDLAKAVDALGQPAKLGWIQYVKVYQDAGDTWSAEIDAFAIVPEPATTMLLLGVVVATLAVRRRRKKMKCLLVLVGLAGLLGATGSAGAAPYNLNGNWVEVDYWTGSGANETIIVIDWNMTNGPYISEAHAWGFRWDGTAYLAGTLAAIDAAGSLDLTYGYGGGFLLHAFYGDAGGDKHNTQSPIDYAGWWWLGDTTDGGLTWTANLVGTNAKTLAHGRIEGLNMDSGAWTGATLTIPVPEPATIGLLAAGAGAILLRLRRRR